jgi:hypothetical protein
MGTTRPMGVGAMVGTVAETDFRLDVCYGRRERRRAHRTLIVGLALS